MSFDVCAMVPVTGQTAAASTSCKADLGLGENRGAKGAGGGGMGGDRDYQTQHFYTVESN